MTPQDYIQPSPLYSVYPRPWSVAKTMASLVVGQLGEDELYALVRGSHFSVATLEPDKGYYTGNTEAIPRLGIPALKMQDAGQGFRSTRDQAGTTTAFPCLLALAATWDGALVRRTAAAIGEEFKGKGANVMLGPALNVHRVPQNGRNFEYLSGEDPSLGATLAYQFVRGVQGQGVMATVKHFAFNEQETDRQMENSVVDETTAWRLYYPPFQGAVAAGATAVMCAYNRVNGTHACQNRDLLQRDLKERMGFSGFVMSDWYARHETDAYQKGLDQDMPGGSDFFATAFSQTTRDKVDRLPMAMQTMQQAAHRILTSIYRLKLDEAPGCSPPACLAELSSDQRTAAHRWVAREAATSSVVLLKNEGDVLPLELARVSSIAVLGVAADAKPSNDAMGEDYYSGGGSGHVQLLNVTTPLQAISRRAAEAGIRVVEDLKEASVCVVIVATTSSEGEDRQTLEIDGTSDILLAADTCKRTVVLMQTPGAVLTQWRDKVAAIANLFLGGEETAHAWASVLFGDATPSGKLPISFPEDMSSVIGPVADGDVKYAEGLFTSYRSQAMQAAFPFGHGLSYATFRLDAPVPSVCYGMPCLKVNVTNTHAKRLGREVVQAYGKGIPSLGAPKLALTSFQKTGVLKPGGFEEVWLKMPQSAATVSLATQAAQAGAQDVVFLVGCSSADIRHSVSVPASVFQGAR